MLFKHLQMGYNTTPNPLGDWGKQLGLWWLAKNGEGEAVEANPTDEC